MVYPGHSWWSGFGSPLDKEYLQNTAFSFGTLRPYKLNLN
jgi:hypothetical protein